MRMMFKGSRIECEHPNEMLYKFEGNLLMSGGVTVPLSVDQILLRGSSLRNTDYIYGIVVFTGHDTKIMKNSVKSKVKFSKLERSTNTYIMIIMVLQFILALSSALVNTIWEVVYKDEFGYIYPTGEYYSFFINLVILLGQWFLSLVNIVPISLMVTLECVKFIQAIYIGLDASIYDESKDMSTSA
jgi:magnesium-transporting ATPase (P-type)